ncbi:MAG: hypothetical protein EBU08_11830 [Micrococcales bacterium]|jgi:hypothetical protein|nr:hypothetical protein [Micrococcales bacterium]
MSGYINDAYLNRIYDDLSKENSDILLKLKNRKQGENEDTEPLYTKEVALINSILSNLVKLRNLRQKISVKEI